jgi:uncharacterized membrane protein
MLQLSTRQYTLFSLKGAVTLAFKKNGFRFTSTGLDKVIKNDAFYPDMKCLLRLLADYLIPSSLVNLTVEQLSELNGYSAILYMAATQATSGNAHYYVFLEKVAGDKITYYTSAGKKIDEDLETFKKKWNGIALLFIKTRYIKERNYYFNVVNQLLRYLSYIGLASAIFFVVKKFLLNANNIFLLPCMLAVAGIGTFFSYRIYLLEHTYAFNKNGNNKCNLYKGFECDKVLSSGFGKLMGILPLSEIALYYYVTLITLIFCHVVIPVQATGITLIMLIAPVFIIPYSIFVQAVLIKSWCINCLMVMCMIMLNAFLAALLFRNQGIYIDASEFWLLLGIVSALFLSSGLIKRVIYRYKAFPEKEKTVKNIKSYQPLFSLMQQSVKEVFNELPTDFQTDIGKSEKNTLVVVLSPYCPACKEIFLQIKESYLLDDINCKITIVLSTTTTRKSKETGLLIVGTAMVQGKDKNIIDILDLWYKESDSDRFKKRIAVKPGINEIKKAEEVLAEHSCFSSQQNVNQLPALFLNNRQVNSFYDYSELKYFLV